MGVWWASMPFNRRIQYASFLENQALIESKWHKNFGDRMNELVLIGQFPDEVQITEDLEKCLLTNQELMLYFANKPFSDPWPF
jgi:hypothetical protein